MAQPQHKGDLEIVQDDKFQNRLWTIERIGWIVIAGFVVAALLGLTGRGGILSDQTQDKPDSLMQLEYERFGRIQTSTTLRVNVLPAAYKEGKFQVLVSQKYLQSVQVEQITPQPASVQVGPDWLTYTFEVATTNQTTAVTFNLLPEKVGSFSGQVAVPDRVPVGFEQFIYP